jgi:hypothetical protein
MIDPAQETLITLNKAREMFPGRCGRVSLSTIYRWALKGQRGHRLETLKIFGRRVTSVEALRRFVSELNRPTEVCCGDPVNGLQVGSGQQHQQRIKDELESLGL